MTELQQFCDITLQSLRVKMTSGTLEEVYINGGPS